MKSWAIFLILLKLLKLLIVSAENSESNHMLILFQPQYLHWSTYYIDFNTYDIISCPSFSSGTCTTNIRICISSCEQNCYAGECLELTDLKKELLQTEDFVKEGFSSKLLKLQEYGTNTKQLRINVTIEPDNDGKTLKQLNFHIMIDPRLSHNHKRQIEIKERKDDYINVQYNSLNFLAEVQLVCEENYYGCFCEKMCKKTENYDCDEKGHHICTENYYPKSQADVPTCQKITKEIVFSQCSTLCTDGLIDISKNQISYCDQCGLLRCHTGYTLNKETNKCEMYDCKYQKRDFMCKKGGRCKSTPKTLQSTGGFYVCDCRLTNYTGLYCNEENDYKPSTLATNYTTTTYMITKETHTPQKLNSASVRNKITNCFVVMLLFHSLLM